MHRKISLISLVLLIVAAIDSIRNLPAAALFGSSLPFFFLLSAVIFLFPISLVSAEFSSRFHEQGGVFYWVRHAFGEKIAVLSIWLQWINTMVWYPTILSFIAGTAAYLYDPELAQNKIYLTAFILVIFWSLTWLNLRGIHLSVKINSICGVLGTLLPMALLIGLAVIWLLSGNTPQVSFALPSFNGSNNWVSLIAIMASFLGMELAGVHVSDIANPQKNFPKALAWAVAILLATMLFGSLSIAVVIPGQQIHLIDGIMQTFSTFFRELGIPGAASVLPLFIVVGSVGGMINWLISPAKGLLQAAEHQFLPIFFTKKNEHGVASRILYAQAILVSLLCLVFILMPNVNGFYWFLTDLSTELYMCMYVLIFLSALKLGRPRKDSNGYRIPRGFRTLACALGLIGCALTIFVGYLPPEGIDVGSTSRYFLLILSGNILSIAPVFLLWQHKKCSVK